MCLTRPSRQPVDPRGQKICHCRGQGNCKSWDVMAWKHFLHYWPCVTYNDMTPHYWPFRRGTPATGEFASQRTVMERFEVLSWQSKQAIKQTVELLMIWNASYGAHGVSFAVYLSSTCQNSLRLYIWERRWGQQWYVVSITIRRLTDKLKMWYILL